MADNKRLVELALKGLEAERAKIDREILELTSQGGGRTPKVRTRRPRRALAGAGGSVAAAAAKPKRRKSTLTEAGRKKLSEAAKKRWAANRKTGKTTL